MSSSPAEGWNRIPVHVRNAIEAGVVLDPLVCEDVALLQDFAGGLVDSYEPQTAGDWLQVELASTSWWQLQRVRKAHTHRLTQQIKSVTRKERLIEQDRREQSGQKEGLMTLLATVDEEGRPRQQDHAVVLKRPDLERLQDLGEWLRKAQKAPIVELKHHPCFLAFLTDAKGSLMRKHKMTPQEYLDDRAPHHLGVLRRQLVAWCAEQKAELEAYFRELESVTKKVSEIATPKGPELRAITACEKSLVDAVGKLEAAHLRRQEGEHEHGRRARRARSSAR